MLVIFKCSEDRTYGSLLVVHDTALKASTVPWLLPGVCVFAACFLSAPVLGS